MILGAIGWFVADGALAIAGLGQFAASGTGAAAFVGAGVGRALGALLAAFAAFYRIPPRRVKHDSSRGERT